MGLNIDEMLRTETTLLVADAQVMKVKAFTELAQKESLRQEDWTRFWKMVRALNV